MIKHECTIDEDGNCPQCELNERWAEERQERWDFHRRIFEREFPKVEEFPTPYEFGKMENGEWD